VADAIGARAYLDRPRSLPALSRPAKLAGRMGARRIGR